jgi:hypothetical protein
MAVDDRVADGDGLDGSCDDDGYLDNPEADTAVDCHWQIDEVLIVVLLAAATLRIVMAVVSQFPFYSLQAGQSTVIRFGYVLMGAEFADGPGVVLLLTILGLVWFASLRRLEDPTLDPDEADIRRRRAHRALTWLWVLFTVTAIGTLTMTLGVYLFYGSPSDSGIANGTVDSTSLYAHLLGTGGYEAAYLVVALGGLWATLQLRANASVVDGPLDGEWDEAWPSAPEI